VCDATATASYLPIPSHRPSLVTTDTSATQWRQAATDTMAGNKVGFVTCAGEVARGRNVPGLAIPRTRRLAAEVVIAAVFEAPLGAPEVVSRRPFRRLGPTHRSGQFRCAGTTARWISEVTAKVTPSSAVSKNGVGLFDRSQPAILAVCVRDRRRLTAARRLDVDTLLEDRKTGRSKSAEKIRSEDAHAFAVLSETFARK